MHGSLGMYALVAYIRMSFSSKHTLCRNICMYHWVCIKMTYSSRLTCVRSYIQMNVLWMENWAYVDALEWIILLNDLVWMPHNMLHVLIATSNDHLNPFAD